MSIASTPVLTLTVAATATLVANRFVTALGAQTGAAGNALGVARSAAVSGERISVDALGTATVEAGAAISAGALVEADSVGRAVTKSAGVTLGRALEAAAGAGSLIEVLLIPN